MNATTISILDAQKEILAAVEHAVSMVASTLGPNGKNVLIRVANSVRVTKDGHQVLHNYQTDNAVHNAVVQAIKDAAARTAMEVGDGTTTTTVMCGAMLKKINELFERGVPFQTIRNVLNEMLTFTVERVQKHAIHVEKEGVYDVGLLNSIGMTSSNADSVIVSQVLKAFMDVEYRGLVTIRKGDALADRVAIRDGFCFDSGFLTKQIEDIHGANGHFKNPLISIFDYEMDAEKIAENLQRNALDINRYGYVIFCGETPDDEIRKVLEIARINRVDFRQIAMVRVPFYGDTRLKFMADLDTYLGDYGSRDQRYTLEVNIRPSETIIKCNGGNKELARRIEELEKLSKEAGYKYNVNNRTHERLARLRGKSAIIYIGGVSREIQQERYDVFEDVVGAIRSVITDGVVAGGGETFTAIANEMIAEFLPKKEEKEEKQEPLGDMITRAEVAPKPVDYRIMVIEGVADVLKIPQQLIGSVESDTMPLDPALSAIAAVSNGWPTALQLSNTSGIIIR